MSDISFGYNFSKLNDFARIVIILRQDSYRNNGPYKNMPEAKKQAKEICNLLGLTEFSMQLQGMSQEDIYNLVID
jgi:hypothetical protein